STSARMPSIEWECRTARESYLDQVAALLRHIQRGDIYEVNYCIKRVAKDPGFDPFISFERLMRNTDAPFAGFLRMGDRFALCMSPERFLNFRGGKVKGEPMKGTRRRGVDPAEDDLMKHELQNDPKERSENIMAVDVMRNDLSQVAAPNSVQVTELCAVRTYPKVHQMVTTIEADLQPARSQFDAVRAAFPMASMTGAPKYRAMQLIEAAEDQQRGLYSGTMGFFAPDGTADLNVVIRTVLFNASSGELSLSTGSALTALCDPQQEWEECEVKALSVINALADA
ncbi:MAG TPA: anthranilate synthase component I family protein, partial [Flavobacteriales bacterium]|nr:anthranilate synthase component I family protein [Flavobacteriales bacterium]